MRLLLRAVRLASGKTSNRCMSEKQDLPGNEADTFDAWLSERKPCDEDDCLLREGVGLSEYRIAASLGRGGCGEVYSARHERLGSMAAVKILFKDTPSMRMRFAREAKILAEKRYREFPQFIAYGEYEGRPYLIEELLVPRELPSTDKDVAEFLIKVATAVGRLVWKRILTGKNTSQDRLSYGTKTPNKLRISSECSIGSSGVL